MVDIFDKLLRNVYERSKELGLICSPYKEQKAKSTYLSLLKVDLTTSAGPCTFVRFAAKRPPEEDDNVVQHAIAHEEETRVAEDAPTTSPPTQCPNLAMLVHGRKKGKPTAHASKRRGSIRKRSLKLYGMKGLQLVEGISPILSVSFHTDDFHDLSKNVSCTWTNVKRLKGIEYESANKACNAILALRNKKPGINAWLTLSLQNKSSVPIDEIRRSKKGFKPYILDSFS